MNADRKNVKKKKTKFAFAVSIRILSLSQTGRESIKRAAELISMDIFNWLSIGWACYLEHASIMYKNLSCYLVRLKSDSDVLSSIKLHYIKWLNCFSSKCKHALILSTQPFTTICKLVHIAVSLHFKRKNLRSSFNISQQHSCQPFTNRLINR